MDLRRDPQHELAAGRLLRLASELRTCGNVGVNRHVKLSLELGHRHAVEGDDVVNIEHAANDDLVLCIEDHACRVSLVGHRVVHGLIPIRSRNSRAAITR